MSKITNAVVATESQLMSVVVTTRRVTGSVVAEGMGRKDWALMASRAANVGIGKATTSNSQPGLKPGRILLGAYLKKPRAFIWSQARARGGGRLTPFSLARSSIRLWCSL